MTKKLVYLDSKDGPNYRCVVKESKTGYIEAKLYSRSYLWTPPWQNKKLVTFIDDGAAGVSITVHRPTGNYTIKIDLAELAEIRALAEVVNRTNSTQYFEPLKPKIKI